MCSACATHTPACRACALLLRRQAGVQSEAKREALLDVSAGLLEDLLEEALRDHAEELCAIRMQSARMMSMHVIRMARGGAEGSRRGAWPVRADHTPRSRCSR